VKRTVDETANNYRTHKHTHTHTHVQVMVTPPKGVHKVVISTNIAETSITIPDVVYVVDTGYVKSDSFDAFSKVETLCLDLIAKSSADQRKVGYAICVCAYVCVCLYVLI
jgi:HrpA-like RNA helicase